VLHTYFEPDPDEDLALRATTSDGKMPAVIETPSGKVQAPNSLRPPRDDAPAYGGSSTPSSMDATYRVDRDTSRPDLVKYDDPFLPAVTPFKRLNAYDRVDGSLELSVSNPSLTRIEIGGSVQSGDDQFYGDMMVDLAENSPVRIPSVGPGARVLAAHTLPPVAFELQRDGADNWFIKATERKRVRFIVQLAIPRKVFGSAFSPTATWLTLPKVEPLPADVRPAAERVLARLGVSRSMTPAAAVHALVQHFRGFAPSEQRPTSSGVALFEELALSKKGVCRHRAYAFTVTALQLGLPTRMVRNEAHAWVEVSDGSIWHRIDLGGAAERLDTEQNPNEPMHAPPADPYSWPEGAESARDLVDRMVQNAGGARPGAATGDGGAGDAGTASMPSPAPGPALVDGGGGVLARDTRPASTVQVTFGSERIRRGEPLQVSGRIEADGEGCPNVRVDFSLRADGGRMTQIQSLSTGEDGKFSGAIVIPITMEVGDYEVMVYTPGDARCGASTTP
jgi:transglutaminase-like putative cysteine protease